MGRKDQIRQLENEVRENQKISDELYYQIKALINTEGSSSPKVFELCKKKNELSTDRYFLIRKIENLKDKKGFLGDEICEQGSEGL